MCTSSYTVYYKPYIYKLRNFYVLMALKHFLIYIYMNFIMHTLAVSF